MFNSFNALGTFAFAYAAHNVVGLLLHPKHMDVTAAPGSGARADKRSLMLRSVRLPS